MDKLKKQLSKMIKNGTAEKLEQKYKTRRGKYNDVSTKILGMTHHVALIKLNQGLTKYGRMTLDEMAAFYEAEMNEKVVPNTLQRQMSQARKVFNCENLVLTNCRVRFKDGTSKTVTWDRKKRKKICINCQSNFSPNLAEFICDTCINTPQDLEPQNRKECKQ